MPDPGADPRLSAAHSGRVRGAERELTHLLSQIAAIGRDGQNPNPHGAPYTPLPPALWGDLAEVLGDLSATARRFGELTGAERAPGRQGLAAARAAVSARLAQVEDTLEDLAPERLQARYGALPPETAAELSALHARMTELAGQARSLLDGVSP